MALWKEIIEQSKKQPELCLMKQTSQMRIGEKQYTQLSTYLIEDNSK